MNSWFVRTVLFLSALALRIRYRITYTGLQQIQNALKGTSKGTLFLPNHPAVFIDPLVVSIPLIRFFAIRPLVIEYMYFQRLLHALFRRIKALPIPNFSTGFNPIKLKRAEKMLSAMSEGLKVGENFLIYPSGTTKLTAKEHIGGAFGVHQLIQENPDMNIVLVRMTGLWGSSFSRALTAGEAIDTKKVLINAVWTLIKNFLFFVPKRTIEVTFELAPSDFPRKGQKSDLNRYLEQWYNKPFAKGEEPLSLVSYSFLYKDIPEIAAAKSDVCDLASVPKQVQDEIVAKVSSLSKVPKNQVLPDLLLVEHLGLDSLDMAELIVFLEEKYDVPAVTPQDLTTVLRLFMVATKRYVKKQEPEKVWKKGSWNKKRSHELLKFPDAKTIPEAFFKACDSHLFTIAAADSRVGPITYYTFKKMVLILSEEIKKLSGKRIGILLPASTTSMALVIACQYAGKTPVMINWTVGGKHLDAVVDVAGIEVVLSSWAFLDNLENVDLSRIEPLIKVLEELKVEIAFSDILKASYKAFFSSKTFSFSHLDPDDEAVVLFTSGTESMPKGVPLTHANVLTNQKAALEMVALYQDDALLSFLPPFHSFGFSVTGILPLICGLKTVFYPNPTDSKRLIQAVKEWNVSMLCSAPTFLKNMIQPQDKEHLARLRLIISGAEKATDELLSLLTSVVPKCLFYEGYGITECAPILCVNTTGNKKNGVGKPLSNVKVIVVEPENLQKECPIGSVGMILASGPNVFSGYLNKTAQSPFIERDGIKWYQTGDLGSITADGNLIISGRLKRFVKIGGEMVSLSAIEEAMRALSKKSNVEQFVVCPQGDVLGKVQLVLFSIHDLEVSDVNQVLRKYGFSNLVKIDRVIVVDAIPLTATGKVSYRALENLGEDK